MQGKRDGRRTRGREAIVVKCVKMFLELSTALEHSTALALTLAALHPMLGVVALTSSFCFWVYCCDPRRFAQCSW